MDFILKEGNETDIPDIINKKWKIKNGILSA